MKTKIQSLLLILGLSVSMFAWANPDYLVDADWLSEHIEDENLVVLEVRYHPHRYHAVGHIPGAIQVKRFKDLADNNSLTVTCFPSREQFQETLREWGVTMESTLVIYDDTRTVTSARLWVLLKLYGFPMEQVKVLNGGTIGWSAFEEMSQEATPPHARSNIELKPADQSIYVEFPDKARRDTGNYLDWLTAEVGKALDEWQDLGDTVEQLSDALAFAHLKFFDGWYKRNVHQTYMQFEAVR